MINPPLEDIEQKKLVQWLRLKKIFAFAVPNGSHLAGDARRRAIQTNKLKETGVKVGVSDMIVMLPNKILFIELKRAPKTLKSGKQSVSHTKVSEEQKSFLNAVNEFEYAKGLICYGASEAIEKISEFL